VLEIVLDLLYFGKRNHWIDHTRLTISRVIWHWILS